MRLRFRFAFMASAMFIAAGCSTERTPQTPKVASPTPALPAVMPAAHDAGATMAAPDPAASTTAPVAAKDEPDSPPSSTEDPNPTIGVAIPPSVDADDVREAVFRHMFGQNASGIQQGSGVYCLEVENQRDPTAGFLSRMHDVRTPVKAVSKCSASADKGVIDKSTGKHGLIFRIESVAFKDGHHATVNGGYYEAGLSASGNIYTVELRGTTWVVTKDQMMWIS